MKWRAVLLLTTMAAALIVASGVALAQVVTCDSTPPCYGTPEGDAITGTDSGETIYAYEGNDDVHALGGEDIVYGGPGYDTLSGNFGNDKVYGGGGNDEIEADARDTSFGNVDYTYGGGGNDTIYALEGRADIIDCGKGTRDLVFYDDGLDRLKGCERKSG